MRILKRAMVKEELVAMTGDLEKSLILNQFLYWSERVADFDKFLLEEKRTAENNEHTSIELLNGWIYKDMEELREEIMITSSISTLSRKINDLIENGWIDRRRNPKHRWDKRYQYRVNLIKISSDLIKIGYTLQGYKIDIQMLINPYLQNDDTKLHNEKSNLHNDDSSLHNDSSNLHSDGAITEITTETTTEITTHTTKEIEEVMCVLDKKITLKEGEKLFKIANGDIELIKAKYEVAKATRHDNFMGFMIRAIEENWQMPKSQQGVARERKTDFHNFENRTSKYSPEELEKMVLRKKE